MNDVPSYTLTTRLSTFKDQAGMLSSSVHANKCPKSFNGNTFTICFCNDRDLIGSENAFQLQSDRSFFTKLWAASVCNKLAPVNSAVDVILTESHPR